MTDYGRTLEFGCSLVPNAADPVVEYAVHADRLGLDLVGIQDHPYQRRYLDTWTLLSVVAARTSRLRVFPDVACLPLRAPAVLAKAAASLDLLTGGRVELGLGAGGFWDAIEAYGGPRRTPRESFQALTEAVTVIREIWSGERNRRVDGEIYQLKGAQSGPPPAHPIEIWLGVSGPKALALLGRAADGWIPSSTWAPPERLPELNARIDESATAAGRQPGDIRRLYNLMGSVQSGSEGFLRGPAEQWVEELTDLAVGYGVDTFVFWPEGEVKAQLSAFAEEIVPQVRLQVSLERGEQ